ncbi:MAG: TadE/TadG family type IV pilus assembly protein [Boseongicola sp.]
MGLDSRNFIKREDGAALAEFAMVLPLLMLVLFTILSWGYSLTLLDSMYDAARQGARQVSVGQMTIVQAENATETELENRWPNQFTVNITEPGGTNDVVANVTTSNFFQIMAFIPFLPPLVAEVTMRKEGA